jgi:diguanylate cyclase (GGDEF)-like protein
VVCLVDQDRQFIKSEAWRQTDHEQRPRTSLSPMFFAEMVAAGAPLDVADARSRPDLSQELQSGERPALAYAGSPISVDGNVLGSLCVAEHEPREWSEADLGSVADMAVAVSTELGLCLAREEIVRNQELVGSHIRVHELLARDAPLREVLGQLVLCAERYDPSVIGCVTLLDAKSQTMHLGAAPNLPAEYTAAIEGLPIGPGGGTCGVAASSGQLTITSDVETDPRWIPIRAPARAAGLRHCWSAPIRGARGEVHGTFAMYGRSPRTPLTEHVTLMEDSARVAGIAIERHRATSQLVHHATHDGLTGLLNRTAVLERLSQSLARSRRTGSQLAVLFIDLDGLEHVNDTLGHDLADDVLRRVAGRLQSAVRITEAVGRFGGDEFVVIAEGVAEIESAAALADRLLAKVAAPLPNMASVSLTASIGIALVNGVTTDAREALRQADRAMHVAKRAGGARYQVV